MNGQKGPQLTVDLSNARDILCRKCASPFFTYAVKMRKLSAIASPDGQEHTISIQTLVCLNCSTEIGAGGQENEQRNKNHKVESET